jgi:hypothetical protein
MRKTAEAQAAAAGEAGKRLPSRRVARECVMDLSIEGVQGYELRCNTRGVQSNHCSFKPEATA